MNSLKIKIKNIKINQRLILSNKLLISKYARFFFFRIVVKLIFQFCPFYKVYHNLLSHETCY